MYSVGDYVVKATDGVCEIVAIEPLDIPNMSKDVLYLHLVPIENRSVKLFMPVNGAEEKLRDVISKDEALKLIDSIPEIEPVIIKEEKQRDKIFKDALLSGEPKQLVAVIKTIYMRNEQRQKEGKKIGAIDEYFLKSAEEKLYSELSFALEKDKESMSSFILESVNKYVK